MTGPSGASEQLQCLQRGGGLPHLIRNIRQPVPLIVIITITTNDIIISLQMTALNRIIEAYLSILGFYQHLTNYSDN